jgi:serine/threonine protein kinase
MPRVYRPDEKIKGYTILRHLNSGGMAISYEARNPEGQSVFFKQYKSPTIRVEWYKGYIAYQKELKARIDAPPTCNFCYRFLDAFEEARCYFQVFEFLDHSWSLQQVFDKVHKKPATVSWESRVIMSKVLLGGINALAKQNVVHSDLKPDNIMLIEDKTIAMRYRLKIIDMDFSILADRQPPWHGHEGYFGTPGYLSPEHLRNEVPQLASDVYTCGLMLYELLAGGHPYLFEDMEPYRNAVLKRTAKPPKLIGTMNAPATNAAVQEMIFRCLEPNPANRPTALEVHHALNGTPPPAFPAPPPITFKREPPPKPVAPAPLPVAELAAEEPAKSEPAPAIVPTTGVLTLIARDGKELAFRVRTDMGSALCSQLYRDDSVYWGSVQFTLDFADGAWSVIPRPGTKNDTLLNGKLVADRTALKTGDQLAVGRAAKGVSKTPLAVRIT